ncbi:branched-chain amino acid transport system II carrier protein [Amphibacillus sp. MSJ-3]|uniref:branched-chain amino acid transport system II carrier protein n=1 Tax=Amphibacillus sp. MSJ-3 TaxID=2841505 RepID=UPI001C0EDBC5|nr:branched-chain amino acid transport system II carrier protein [Amphibacillus sp. MSJ-3]MBU5594077.1 branched-chain amino acid transport system II carrier protein [Amphibacillus sp. MSJ-3]
MNEKLDFKSSLLIGSLLFGLFFGAGNLIFPVHMGQLAGMNTLPATIGFLITGVGLPVLGVIGSALSRSESLYDMAKPINKSYSILFTCALYLTIGPLFAIPRTATVAFEVGLADFIGDEFLQIGLFIFSLIFFIMTLYFSLRPGRILDWVGKYLTPTFLVLLSILIIATFINPMGEVGQFAPQEKYAARPLFTGLIEGYHTMDALASLAFAIVIIANIEKLGVHDPKRKAIETLKSGIVCLIGMGVIYASLAYMGATSLGSVGIGANGGVILSMVGAHYFGFAGQILLAIIVFVACLKTAIGLITSCSQIFREMFPHSISYNKYAVVFTLLSFIIANFGLNTIIQLSLPVLMFLYPLAITLIILSLLSPFIHQQKDVYRWTTGLTIIAALFDFINALPNSIKENVIIAKIINFAGLYLPGFDYGFGWIVPAMIGFIIGLFFWKVREKYLN